MLFGMGRMRMFIEEVFMIKLVLLIFAMLVPALASAADKLSEPFSYSIVGRVCEASKCQLVSASNMVQALMKEDASTPGNYAGEVKSTYSMGKLNFESKIQVSQFAYGSNYQTNLFLSTTETGSSVDHGSAEVIVNSMNELNSIAQYSTPFIDGTTRVEITLVIGPTPEAVLAKAKSLSR
jgi:hypothetical protein